MEYYSALRKNKTLLFEKTQMDLENIILSKINQKEKDKNHIISVTCWMSNRKQQMNKHTDTNGMKFTRGQCEVWDDKEGQGGQIYGER